MYLLAILLPPVAVLLLGRPMLAVLNLVLCCFFYVPGIVHALFMVHSSKNDKRHKELMNAVSNKD
nr:YqaE/Pmp3 family membrane protein [Catenovulum agarivorans]